jgi:hypothetical protein
MELDSLKEIWKETDMKQPVAVANEEIAAMLNKSSSNPIARMIRNVLVETILIIVLFGAVAAYYFIAYNGRFSTIAWVYVVLAAFCTFYYYRKWKLLHNMQCIACQVKSNLKKQVNTLEKYLRLYFFWGTAMVPIVFIFLALLFYYQFPQGTLRPVLPPPAEITVTTWVAWTAFLVVFTIIAWYGNRYYVKRLYGKHIQQLKRLLEQMEE